MAYEKTLIMIKPDGVRRRLVGEVISRFEAKGLVLGRIRILTPDTRIAGTHYAEHVDKPFYDSLVDFITSGPVVAMHWEGESAVSVSRALIGATNPVEALPGTIRGDFGLAVQENLVHGSDSPESAARELAIWFD